MRILTEFYLTLLPQPGEQARHLGNLVKNPTPACVNPVEVITNIGNWRVSVQLYKESTGQMPIQEDIKTAFVVRNQRYKRLGEESTTTNQKKDKPKGKGKGKPKGPPLPDKGKEGWKRQRKEQI